MQRFARTAVAAAMFGWAGFVQAAAGEYNWMREAVDARLDDRLGQIVGDQAKGTARTARIIGGKQSPAGAWPQVVAIINPAVTNDYDAQFCGGTLVGDRWVLTAAHCTFGRSAAQIQVLHGTQVLATVGSNGTRYAVQTIHQHPNYNDTTTDSDAALLELSSAIPGAQSFPILTAAREAALAGSKKVGTVVGWGSTNAAGTVYPTAMRQVDLAVVGRGKCNGPNSYDGEITDTMFCAGAIKKKPQDSCSGDSGGPFLVKDPATPALDYIIAGIVSWGNSCALPDFPGVYSRLAVLGPWVTATMSGSPVASRKACRKLQGAEAAACWDAVFADSEKTLVSLVEATRGRLDPAGIAALEAGQTAWRASLTGTCRLAETIEGSVGRKACLARAIQSRVADVAATSLPVKD